MSLHLEIEVVPDSWAPTRPSNARVSGDAAHPDGGGEVDEPIGSLNLRFNEGHLMRRVFVTLIATSRQFVASSVPAHLCRAGHSTLQGFFNGLQAGAGAQKETRRGGSVAVLIAFAAPLSRPVISLLAARPPAPASDLL